MARCSLDRDVKQPYSSGDQSRAWKDRLLDRVIQGGEKMSYHKFIACFSIGGIFLGMQLSGVSAQEQPDKAIHVIFQEIVQEKYEKPESAVRFVQVETQRPEATAIMPVSMPVYKPPMVGAPGGRVGSGTRGFWATGLADRTGGFAADH